MADYIESPSPPDDPYFINNQHGYDALYYTCKICGAMVKSRDLHLRFHRDIRMMIDKLRILDKL